MSKHIGRKSQWTEVNDMLWVHANGCVMLNSFGTWDALVRYKERAPITSIPKDERPWGDVTKHCGEYKRAREAMIIVEENIKKLRAKNNWDRII